MSEANGWLCNSQLISAKEESEYTEFHRDKGLPFCDNAFVEYLADIRYQNKQNFLHKQNLSFWYETFIEQIHCFLQLPAYLTSLKFIYTQYLSLLYAYIAYEMEQSVPKRRNIKFRSQGITQKEYKQTW